MLERILIPVDGSPLADRILVHASRLILTPGAEVFLVRVVEQGDGEAARLHLDGLKLALAEKGARTSTRVVAGADAAAAILDVAKEIRPSLIALSTHGRTGLARIRRGSVAERILRGAAFPLLLRVPIRHAAVLSLYAREGTAVTAGLIPASAPSS